MRVKRKRVLMDVDEVLCGFYEPVLEAAHRRLGINWTLEENVTCWDVFELFTAHERFILYDEMCTPGFCSTFKVKEGAQEAIEEIRSIADVTPVTRQFPSPTWVHDRALWLEKHFGFKEHEIVNTAAKHLVKGDAFLDDNPQNVISWQQAHPEGVGMLWHTRATRDESQHDHFRVHSWVDFIQKIRDL